jgi:hypothetical protein
MSVSCSSTYLLDLEFALEFDTTVTIGQIRSNTQSKKITLRVCPIVSFLLLVIARK